MSVDKRILARIKKKRKELALIEEQKQKTEECPLGYERCIKEACKYYDVITGKCNYGCQTC